MLTFGPFRLLYEFFTKNSHIIWLRNIVIYTASFHVYRDMYHVLTQMYRFTPTALEHSQRPPPLATPLTVITSARSMATEQVIAQLHV